MVTPIAVITKQQLVLGGETRPAGTLGVRAPETGVGGWGRGWVKGAGGVCPNTVAAIMQSAWSTDGLRTDSLQFQSEFHKTRALNDTKMIFDQLWNQWVWVQILTLHHVW